MKQYTLRDKDNDMSDENTYANLKVYKIFINIKPDCI